MTHSRENMPLDTHKADKHKHGPDGLPEKVEALTGRDLQTLIRANSKPIVSDWIKLGLMVTAVFFSVFIIWSITAPLSTGAVVSGQIAVAGKRNTIEHLEGGIVKNILVRSGDRVEKDAPLVELDPSGTEAQRLDSLTKLYALLVRQKRLDAEWNDTGLPDFATIDGSEIEPMARREIQLLEKSQFEERRALYKRQLKQLEEASLSDKEVLEKSKIIKNNLEEQLRLIEEEVSGIESLLEKGYASKPRLLALKRQREDIKSRLLRTESDIVVQNKRLEENRLEVTKLKTITRQEIAQTLQQTVVDIETHSSRLALIDGQLGRTIVRAPHAGTIMDIQVNTVGEVVNPGGTILELVPNASNLIVSARLNAGDGANIVPGLNAKVRISAFKGRNAPVLPGTVTSVSPDVLEDERTGEAYYEVEIKLGDDALAKLGDTQTLQPGFPVEAVIETAKQPVIAYLLAPILNTVEKAFVEQ